MFQALFQHCNENCIQLGNVWSINFSQSLETVNNLEVSTEVNRPFNIFTLKDEMTHT